MGTNQNPIIGNNIREKYDIINQMMEEIESGKVSSDFKKGALGRIKELIKDLLNIKDQIGNKVENIRDRLTQEGDVIKMINNLYDFENIIIGNLTKRDKRDFMKNPNYEAKVIHIDNRDSGTTGILNVR